MIDPNESLCVDIWRNWSECPPQIPWAPIILRGCGLVSRWQHLLAFGVSRIDWRPSGIYREEFYRVTGRWE